MKKQNRLIKFCKPVKYSLTLLSAWAVIFSVMPIHANGIIEVDGTKYLYINGQVKNGIIEYENKTYLSDANGKLLSGWVQTSKTELKYFDPETFEAADGEIEIDNQKYVLENGSLKTGIQETGEIYDKKGQKLQKGYLTVGMDTYLIDDNGEYITGWVEEEKQPKKYFKNDGVMAVGETKIGDTKYNFQSNGELLTGWVETEIVVSNDTTTMKDNKEETQEVSNDLQTAIKQNDFIFQEVSEVMTSDKEETSTETDTNKNEEKSNEEEKKTVIKTEPEEDKESEETDNEKIQEDKDVSETKKDDEKKRTDSNNAKSNNADTTSEPVVKTKKVKMYYTKTGYAIKDKIQTINKKNYAFDKNGYLLTKSNTKFYVNEDGTARLMSEWEQEQAEIQEQQRKQQEEYQKKQQEALKKQQEAAKEKAQNTNIPESSNGKDFTAAEMQQMVELAYSKLGTNQTCTWLPAQALASVYGGNWQSYVNWSENYAQYGRWVSAEEARPGSILIYQNHCALYLGGGLAIHSGYNGYQTVISTVQCSNPLIGYLQPQH